MAATFVFDGTVRRTMRTGRGRPRRATVRVDAIVRAPAPLVDLVGQTVIVELATGRVHPGRRRFFTTPVMFSETVVVRAERARQAPRSGNKPLTDRRASSALLRRVNAADVIISGRVIGTHRPSSGRRRAIAPSGAPPVTEHEPRWAEAAISVTAVHKGERVGRVLRVRFPASYDVAWARAPKLHRGQRGVFLLKRAGRAFTALDPADVQPIARAPAIAALRRAPRRTLSP